MGQVEVSKALQQCEKEGVTHLELDLRGNLGGLVSQGVETARLFLDGVSQNGFLPRRHILLYGPSSRPPLGPRQAHGHAAER